MASELAFALINPYTIAKSRTGGVIGRLMSRTGLNLVAARMFAPSSELARRYADSFTYGEGKDRETVFMLGDYVRRNYMPDLASGKPRRVLMLLFEGENAIQRVREATGHVRSGWVGGETIRDTYGDFLLDENGQVKYFEPAILVAPSAERAAVVLRLWAEYSEKDGGLVENAVDVSDGDGIQTTLVLIKPDNFRFPSLRAGNIIDLLSRSGLRIIGIRKFQMSVGQAEEFYGPVRESLRRKCGAVGAQQAAKLLQDTFGVEISESVRASLAAEIGAVAAERNFEKIVNFMTGYFPSQCAEVDRLRPGKEDCLGLVYRGMSAVEKIRYLLGPTDPEQAQPGSVRREFGSDIMVNAAHASDSPENAAREMKIIRIEEDSIREWVTKYYGSE